MNEIRITAAMDEAVPSTIQIQCELNWIQNEMDFTLNGTNIWLCIHEANSVQMVPYVNFRTLSTEFNKKYSGYQY